MARQLAQRACRKAPPHGEGELASVRQAHAEVGFEGRPRIEAQQRRRLSEPRGQTRIGQRCLGARRRRAARAQRWCHRIHVGACAGPRRDISLGEQQVIHRNDRIARGLQCLGQGTRARQPQAGAQPARHDRVAQLPMQLARALPGAAPRQYQVEVEHRTH